ncbi:RNA polymerase sigma-70 factor (sigma-E family) [Catenulispora sp. EB89]|uniref:SigE family RNA polymerase sigma factor n=1 Tax=Catenulispora sp. EB89 TaxID=3156257 RepID=UPI0035130DA4
MRGPDEAEFDELVAGRAHALRRTAYLMCGDWHQAEDLVQVTFMKLHASWQRVRRQEAFDAYLRKTLLRSFIDEKRRARWRREAPTAVLPEVVAPGPEPDGVRDMLVGGLRQLPPRQRATLVLRYFEDQSVEETARLLGCSPGTVKSQTSKGLAALRAIVDPALLARTEELA